MQAAFEALSGNGPVMIKDMAEYLSISEDTVKDRIQKGAARGANLRCKKGVVYSGEQAE